MSRVLALALLLTALSGSALAPLQPITALAPFEIWADGFGNLRGIVADGGDVLYVADREAGTVSRLDQAGGRTVVARHLARPVGLALDPAGRVLVAEERGARVVRLDPGGSHTPVAQGIKQPRWLAVSEDGTLYISARRLKPDPDPEPDDDSAESQMILALAPHGELSPFADGFAGLQGLVVDRGAVYAATSGLRGTQRRGAVYRIPVLPGGQAGPPETVEPGGVVQRPVGLAIDRLGGLYVSARIADLGGERARHAIVKLQPDGAAVRFAAHLDGPRGLALDSHGHLYVADAGAGRILRFLAPPAPAVPGAPRFTNQAAVTLAGTTVPGARVDVLLDHGLPPVVTMSTDAGAFATSIVPAANTDNAIAVLATAAGGDGLTSAATAVDLVHDAIAPAAVLQAPPAGGFVRGAVVIRAEAGDAGTQIATLDLHAAGRWLDTSVAPPPPAPAVEATASWATGDVQDGAHTLAAIATDRAGNSATMGRVVVVDNTAPDTEITAGPSDAITQPSATFAFTGEDNLTPVSSLRFSWRLDGGAWSAFTGATTVTVAELTTGSHLFEVIARDLAGNDDPTPAARTFALSPVGRLGIAITEPVAGAAVAVGAVLVRGTVDAAAGPVSVSVNGFAALVHGAQWAAEVPIAPGDNVVTAVAMAPSGAEATASLIVSGSAGLPSISFRAEPPSGVGPLAVTWRIASRGPRPLIGFELDSTGAAGFGAPQAVLDGTQSIYPAAGLLFPTVRAIDDQGNVYVARTVVQVEDAQGASVRFQELWNGFRARLLAGDHTGALTYLSPGLRPRFQPIFQQLGADLPAVATALGPIELIDSLDDLAEAAIVQLENGSPFLYFIYFRRDNRGRWLIQEM
jgi:sugar lactone lactonase YvrE